MAFNYLSLAQPGVQGLKPYEPGKPIETLERELGIRNSIKLASNENPLGPSPKGIIALQSAVHGLSLYPDGAGHALKSAIARRVGCEPSAVTLGNGSSEILELVARAFLGPGLELIFSEHAFAVYALVGQASGATLRAAGAHPGDHMQPYGHCLENFAGLITASTRVIFIANPNNPTGSWLNASELHRFIASVPAHVIVVIDEAYCEYVEEAEYPDSTRWLREFPNLVVTRTFSKIHGLAGLRLGYGISGLEVAGILNRVRQPFNTNSLAQCAGLAALNDGEHVARSREVNSEGLRQLIQGFMAQNLPYIPSVGNFLCVDVGRDAAPVYHALLKLGVIVRPIANYGFPNHLRISIGTHDQNMRALSALHTVLSET